MLPILETTPCLLTSFLSAEVVALDKALPPLLVGQVAVEVAVAAPSTQEHWELKIKVSAVAMALAPTR
jgi:hypothetical protein